VGCGHSSPDHEVLIVNPSTRLRCAEGGIGEIWVRGPSISSGYFDNPAETDAAFHASLADTEEGPFLRTGDLGAIVRGELYVTGRLKDVLIIRGRNYYPHDLESTVSSSHEAMRPNCGAVFTIPLQGEERLVIVQEVKEGTAEPAPEQTLRTQLTRVIRQAVSREHALQVYAVILLPPRGLPKTSSGKVQRQLCRSLFLENKLEPISDWRIDRANGVEEH